MITKGRTIEDMWQSALRAQMPPKEKEPISITEKRRRNALASKKYSKTEKGKKANVVKCHNYFTNHRNECKLRVKKYQDRFKEVYGVSLMAWNYWSNKLSHNRCTEADVPERYACVLNDWKTTGHYKLD